MESFPFFFFLSFNRTNDPIFSGRYLIGSFKIVLKRYVKSAPRTSQEAVERRFGEQQYIRIRFFRWCGPVRWEELAMVQVDADARNASNVLNPRNRAATTEVRHRQEISLRVLRSVGHIKRGRTCSAILSSWQHREASRKRRVN